MEISKSTLPAVRYPSAVLSPHPISASLGRRLEYANFIPGESLDEYLTRTNLMPPVPSDFIFTMNGVVIPVDKLDVAFPRVRDMVIIRARVRDGGDDGGSSPIRIVLMIAVMVAAFYTGGAALSAWGPVAGGIVQAGVMVAGMLLVNALVPIKIPSFDESQPSPTYALTGTANRIRAYEPLPVAFGVVRMFPDHGAKPFTMYENNDQLLIQVFNFGLTDVSLSDYKIGNTAITDFYGVVAPEESPGNTGVITGYPSNVDVVAGADLVLNAGTYVTKTSSPNTTRLVVDISGISFFFDPEKGHATTRLTLEIEYRATASSDPWLPFFREYIIGLVWSTSNITYIVNNDKELLRIPYQCSVPEGQYDVRVKLHDLLQTKSTITSCNDNGDNCASEVVRYVIWNDHALNGENATQVISFDQLNSYQSDDSDYTNQKRVGLEIVATGQINGRIDDFNAIVSVTIPTWNGVAWVDAISSNPAWIWLAIARGKHDAITGMRIYGAGLSDTGIDIETIKLWGAWCDDKNLECNIVFDSKITAIDMLNTVARCGRATTTWSNGSMGVIYDEANKSPVAMFGMSNIIHGSFKVNYASEQLVDEIIVEFVNPVLDWKRDTVRATVPGVTTPINSLNIYLPGITDETQAGREANLIAAEQFYRRRIVTWESDMEGLSVQRGDVSVLSHDLTQWDYSGRLVSGTTTTLELDRPVPFTPATQHYIGVRYPDGTYVTRTVNFAGVENLINEPEAFDDAYWTKVNSSILPNNTNAPDGTMTADKLVADATALAHHFHNSPGETVGVGTATFSVYAKAAEHPGLRMLLWNSTDGSRGVTDFDLTTGSVVSGTGVITNEGGGYYRCSVSATNTTGIEMPHVYVLNSSFTTAFTGNDFDGIYLWGAMLNVGTLADYINDTNVITLGTALPSAPDLDVDNIPMDYLWFFAPTATPGKLVKITDIKPITEDRVQIIATDEEDDFYLAEEDTYTYVPPSTFIGDIPIISGLGLVENLVIVGSGFGSKVLVTWLVSGEYGGAFIRAGDEDTPMRDIGRTLDRTFAFDWKTDQTVTVEVVCHNLNYESSDVSRAEASLALIGKMRLPTDVANFSALQNGATIVFRWSPAPEIDLAGTEIRYGVRGSSTWENGTPLTEVTKGTNITSAAVPDGDWTFYVKHRDTSLNYSVNAVSSDVLFETEQDIIIQVEQAPLWPGTLTNLVYHHTGKLVPQSQDVDSTDGGTILWAEDTVFSEFVHNPYLTCTYVSPEIDIGFDDTVRLWGDIQSALGPLEIGVANPLLEIDYRVDGGVYDGFEPWTIGNAFLRYAKFAAVIDTSVGNVYLSGFNPTVDLIERTDNQLVTVATGGSTIVFDRPFHIAPWGSASPVTADSGNPASATITLITATQGLVNIYNTAGTSVSGTAVITLTGV